MRRFRTVSRDPRWITTKYPTKQADGSIVPAGSRAFYYPGGKTMLFGAAADEAAAKFECERWDEDQYSSGYGV